MTVSWDELRSRLLARSASPLEFMRESLLICEENLHQVAAALRNPETAALFRAVQDRASADIGEPAIWPMEHPDKFVGRLLDSSVERIEPLAAAVAVRAVAGAFDQRFADTMAAEIALAGRRLALTDGVLVVAPFSGISTSTVRRDGPRLGPRGGYLADHPNEPARTTRCRLFHPAADSTLSVVLDASRASLLATALSGLPAAATVHPVVEHAREEDLEVVGDGVFGVGPRDGERAWHTTVSMLEEVARKGARIAVVPELNVHGDIEPNLEGHAVPALVLSGSRHVAVGSRRLNEAVLHLHGEAVVTHQKLRPFFTVDDDVPLHRESVDAGDTITVLYCGQWAVAALICADVNEDEVGAILGALGVNLLLVASMTTAIGFFQVRLSSLVQNSRGLAVWANDPVGHDGVETSAFFFPSQYDQMSSLTESLPASYVHDWTGGRRPSPGRSSSGP